MAQQLEQLRADNKVLLCSLTEAQVGDELGWCGRPTKAVAREGLAACSPSSPASLLPSTAPHAITHTPTPLPPAADLQAAAACDAPAGR